MAVDMLVDSGKLDACCAAEAAAIIAKGGGTAPLAYDFANNKGFADAIAAIPSGGGSLPPSVSKIDGGSFMLASDTTCSQYEIAHNMGVSPLGFMIWTDELNGFDSQSKQYLVWANTRIFTFRIDSTTIRNGIYGICARQNSGIINQYQSFHYDINSAGRWCNASRIRPYITDKYFKADITYKWIAWA